MVFDYAILRLISDITLLSTIFFDEMRLKVILFLHLMKNSQKRAQYCALFNLYN